MTNNAGPSATSLDVLTGAIRSGAFVRVSVTRTKTTQPDHYVGQPIALAEDHGNDRVSKLVMRLRNGDRFEWVTITMSRVGAVRIVPRPTTAYPQRATELRL